jgi:hypothetical protein
MKRATLNVGSLAACGFNRFDGASVSQKVSQSQAGVAGVVKWHYLPQS